MEFRFGGLRSLFRIENEVRFPAEREGQMEWKVEIVDGVQDFCREALCPEWSFSRNGAAMCLPVYENSLSFEVGFKAD
ncbi:hypothetical protein LCGC14_2669690 [marine sediment metagenome]|uniref:Uncharacterized protein n=1 Tax=marine sediment metagenome TaxID=412755 RepID=A0A0F8ZPI6_9ZZZZ